MRSIRTTLIVGSVVATVGTLSLSGAAVYRGARSTLLHQLDQRLLDQMRVIGSVVKHTPDGMEVEIEDLDIPELSSPSGHGYLEVWLGADSVLYRSPRLGEADLPALASLELNRPALGWMRTSAGARARVVDVRSEAVVDPEDWAEVHQAPPAPPAIRVAVAAETTDSDAFLARLRNMLIAIGGLGGLTVAGVLAAVIRQGLSPLDHLASEIAGLNDRDLASRVQMPDAPREVKPVVDQLNQMLERLQVAFERERTFSSDIAHELRTPLAGLRATLEVTLARSRSEPDYRQALDGLLGMVRRVQGMVETLLYLGRLEAGQVDIERRAFDPCELLRSSWLAFAERAGARDLAVTWSLAEGVNVTSDPALLGVAIRNLLDNAVAYVDQAGRVRIEVIEAPGQVVLRIANSGSQLDQERVSELLRRFSRADSSRRAHGDHFGLGLPLTSRIAAALHCRLDITSTMGGEFLASLAMPRA